MSFLRRGGIGAVLGRIGRHAASKPARDGVSRGGGLPAAGAASKETAMVALAANARDAAAVRSARARGLRGWLLFLILLVFAMVMVGGATRLTESGLSITEWDLVTGTVPPLDDAGWQAAFDLYKQSPQYEILNRGMSLSDFKTIYWWEWAHRELGRFIGLVYIAGFFWFVGQAERAAADRRCVLAGVGVLLGAQGVVGWIMVASGLKPGMTAVAPLKLTLHLLLASLLFAALIALFVRLGGAIREPASARGIARRASSSCSPSCRSRLAGSSPGTMPASSTTPGR